MNDKIEKLPKWVQEHVADLQRQRDVAVQALNEHCNNQKPSPFYSDELICDGETKGPTSKRFYYQAYKMEVEHAGIVLRITTHNKGKIGLQWGKSDRLYDGVALIPSSHMAVELIPIVVPRGGENEC